jgi:hypothetical protein
MAGILEKAKQIFSEIKTAPIHNKIGLSLGGTSLGLGIANYKNNQARMQADLKKQDIEAKSLSALQKIHKALVQKSEEGKVK